MKYSMNLTGCYQNGYDAGYEKGLSNGYNNTIQLMCEVMALMLYDAEWQIDEIQEFADRIVRGVEYASQHKAEWKEMVEEHRRANDINIRFTVNNKL